MIINVSGGLDAHRPANLSIGRWASMCLDILQDEAVDRPLLRAHVIHRLFHTPSAGSVPAPASGRRQHSHLTLPANRTRVLLPVAYQTCSPLSIGILNEFPTIQARGCRCTRSREKRDGPGPVIPPAHPTHPQRGPSARSRRQTSGQCSAARRASPPYPPPPAARHRAPAQCSFPPSPAPAPAPAHQPPERAVLAGRAAPPGGRRPENPQSPARAAAARLPPSASGGQHS